MNKVQTLGRLFRGLRLASLLASLVGSLCSCLAPLAASGGAQGAAPAVMVTRYEVGGSSLDSMSEYSAPILHYLGESPSSILVIRLCSDKPLPVAIATAAVEPVTLGRYLSRYSVPEERIVVSRSESCAGKLADTTATELWVAPAGGPPPDAKESVKLCQVKVRELKSHADETKGVKIGVSNGNLAVRRLVSELKADPDSTGIVLGYYLGEPADALEKQLARAQRLLAESGLPPGRYYARPMHWTGFPEVEHLLGNLSVRLVKVCGPCAREREAEKEQVIWIDPK
jgi:hypothetical protein